MLTNRQATGARAWIGVRAIAIAVAAACAGIGPGVRADTVKLRRFEPRQPLARNMAVRATQIHQKQDAPTLRRRSRFRHFGLETKHLRSLSREAAGSQEGDEKQQNRGA